jgi:hypothetical protein
MILVVENFDLLEDLEGNSTSHIDALDKLLGVIGVSKPSQTSASTSQICLISTQSKSRFLRERCHGVEPFDTTRHFSDGRYNVAEQLLRSDLSFWGG